MMAVVQRVSCASVRVDGVTVGAIRRGLLILLGVKLGDTIQNSEHLCEKVLRLRMFPDPEGKMNRNIREAAGEILVVSQFTLYGDTDKGSRPSFSQAAPAVEAKILYDHFVQRFKTAGLVTASGVFQAKMEVELINDGPVTLLCRSEK